MSRRGSITHRVAKELASIICPLVCQSPHQLKNTQHFVQQVQQVKLGQGEVITSYDVKALFISVPVDCSTNIVKHRLSQDLTLPQRTQMSIHQIVTLLEFCLKNTSSSRVSIMNRSMVQPWVPPLVYSLATSSWKSLKSKPLTLPPPPTFG